MAHLARLSMAASGRRTLLCLFLMLALAVTEGATVFLLLPLLQLVGVDAGASSMTANRILGRLFDAVSVTPTLEIVLGVFVLVSIAQSLVRRWQTEVSAELQFDIVTTLSERVYNAMSRTSWAAFVKQRSSDFVHVLTREIERVGVAAMYATDMTVTVLASAVYLALAVKTSPALTAVVAVCGAALALLARGRVTAAEETGRMLSASTANLYQTISEHLGSMKGARAYGMQGRHSAIFADALEEVRRTNEQWIRAYSGLRQNMAFGIPIVLAVVVYLGFRVLGISTAELLLLLFLFARLVPRVTSLSERMQHLAVTLPALTAVEEIESRCLASAEPVVVRPQPITFEKIIQFEHVTFAYGAEDLAPALVDVSLAIAKGSTTAIVGPSGAGKSTLADVLLGLLAPTSGRVSVDGETLDAERLAAWRDHVGYVPQDAFFFHASLRANLVWAKPNASDGDLWRALSLAAVDDLVRGLPAGLDTVIGDRGVRLSGGERQRLALARALLREPRVLILDEATSALDSENDVRIQSAVDSLRHDQTVVVITHRLSAIRDADVIHVLDEGRLVETGSWDDLTRRRGSRFLALCAAQHIDIPHAVTLSLASPLGR